jgi:hypothetical protein
MNWTKYTAIGLITAIATLASPTRASGGNEPKGGPPAKHLGDKTLIVTDGPKTCNCTDDDVIATKCHQRKVSVTIGSDIIKVGLEDLVSDCVEVTLEPQTCTWFRYKFACESDGFWGGTSCTLLTFSVMEDAAEPGDC